jgi:hypothetical protein
MNQIIELKIEETKAVVGGIKISAPPVVGIHPQPVLTGSVKAMRRR